MLVANPSPQRLLLFDWRVRGVSIRIRLSTVRRWTTLTPQCVRENRRTARFSPPLPRLLEDKSCVPSRAKEKTKKTRRNEYGSLHERRITHNEIEALGGGSAECAATTLLEQIKVGQFHLWKAAKKRRARKKCRQKTLYSAHCVRRHYSQYGSTALGVSYENPNRKVIDDSICERAVCVCECWAHARLIVRIQMPIRWRRIKTIYAAQRGLLAIYSDYLSREWKHFFSSSRFCLSHFVVSSLVAGRTGTEKSRYSSEVRKKWNSMWIFSPNQTKK